MSNLPAFAVLNVERGTILTRSAWGRSTYDDREAAEERASEADHLTVVEVHDVYTQPSEVPVDSHALGLLADLADNRLAGLEPEDRPEDVAESVEKAYEALGENEGR
jgi:hypothetical protein